MAYRSSSKIATEASAASAAVPVPTGAADKDIAVVSLYLESAAAITPPAGFTQKSDVATNATTQGRLVTFWKRLTGADSGTYTFTWTGSVWRAADCALFSGRVSSGDPFTTVGTADGGSGGRTVTVTGITAAGGDDLVSAMTAYAGLGSAPTMTSLTVRQGASGNDVAMGTQDNVSAGSTSNRTLAYTGGSIGGVKGFLGALAAEPATTPFAGWGVPL